MNNEAINNNTYQDLQCKIVQMPTLQQPGIVKSVLNDREYYFFNKALRKPGVRYKKGTVVCATMKYGKEFVHCLA